jgi:hypothetical protein
MDACVHVCGEATSEPRLMTNCLLKHVMHDQQAALLLLSKSCTMAMAHPHLGGSGDQLPLPQVTYDVALRRLRALGAGAVRQHSRCELFGPAHVHHGDGLGRQEGCAPRAIHPASVWHGVCEPD